MSIKSVIRLRKAQALASGVGKMRNCSEMNIVSWSIDAQPCVRNVRTSSYGEGGHEFTSGNSTRLVVVLLDASHSVC